MPRFTAAEKAAEIEAEASVRIRMYSRNELGLREKLSPKQLRRVELLEEIAREYREQAEAGKLPDDSGLPTAEDVKGILKPFS
jgi:hypothetical protein